MECQWMNKMKILVDADACPGVVKEILYKTSKRLKLTLILVANQYMRFPQSDQIQLIVVNEGPDEADNHIVEIMKSGDLIISADIPLADRVIHKEGFVLDPRGVFLTKENIGQRLAMRNLMYDLRSGGMDTGGPSSYGNKDKQKFANELDRFLTKIS